MTVVDYDALADSYDRRYELYDYPGIRSSLNQSVSNGARVLEASIHTRPARLGTFIDFSPRRSR